MSGSAQLQTWGKLCEHAHMGIGATAILIFCAVVMAACRVSGINWMRTAFATALGSVTLYLAYGFAFRLRMQHDLKLSPHDGQSGMDVLAFAILVAPIATILVVLFFIWITRPEKPTNDR
ncbi:hypothetical protein [Sphingomonas bacterium]|uniref:hypothetical protein n=1 Tax=Sphingomonas bacterium TaxID=1895847 RepID=UPI001576AE76|nr:hypothetical protein [Sphingomonas bacterium]